MTTSHADEPVIDPERFAELADDFGAEGARELLDALVTETERQLQEIRTAHAAGDHESLAHEAHGVKGGALLVGAARLRVAAAHLETLARGGAVPGEAVDALDDAWAATRPELHDPPTAR